MRLIPETRATQTELYLEIRIRSMTPGLQPSVLRGRLSAVVIIDSYSSVNFVF
jgi:hypothetical protein